MNDDERANRLEGLCREMVEALDNALTEEGHLEAMTGKEFPPIRGVIFLTDGEGAGGAMLGYADALEGITDLTNHLRVAVAAAVAEKAVADKHHVQMGVLTQQGIMLLGEN